MIREINVHGWRGTFIVNYRNDPLLHSSHFFLWNPSFTKVLRKKNSFRKLFVIIKSDLNSLIQWIFFFQRDHIHCALHHNQALKKTSVENLTPMDFIPEYTDFWETEVYFLGHDYSHNHKK